MRLRAAAGRSLRAARGTAEPAPGGRPHSAAASLRHRGSASACGHPETWRLRVPIRKGKSVSGHWAACAAPPVPAAALRGAAGHRATEPAAPQARADCQAGEPVQTTDARPSQGGRGGLAPWERRGHGMASGTLLGCAWRGAEGAERSRRVLGSAADSITMSGKERRLVGPESLGTAGLHSSLPLRILKGLRQRRAFPLRSGRGWPPRPRARLEAEIWGSSLRRTRRVQAPVFSG